MPETIDTTPYSGVADLPSPEELAVLLAVQAGFLLPGQAGLLLGLGSGDMPAYRMDVFGRVKCAVEAWLKLLRKEGS